MNTLEDPSLNPPKRGLSATVVAALIGAVAVIVSAVITGLLYYEAGVRDAADRLQPTIVALNNVNATLQAAVGARVTPVITSSTPSATQPAAPPVLQAPRGRLEGVLTDRAGKPLAGIQVGIRGGSEVQTDVQGTFVLVDLAAGDRVIEVRPPSGAGLVTQNILIDVDQTTRANIVYDAQTGALGLLSMTAPVDGSLLEVRRTEENGVTVHRATIFGRSDGLPQIFDRFDVWVLIRSENDAHLWVQRPPALVDRNTNTWRANIILGEIDHPPVDGGRWEIVAVAASADSDIGRIKNTISLSQLPPHVPSNVVTVEIQIK